MPTLELSLLALGVAIALVGFEMVESLRTHYRKDCTECDAHKRRAEEHQLSLQHDYAHEHNLGCNDSECPRNTR